MNKIVFVIGVSVLLNISCKNKEKKPDLFIPNERIVLGIIPFDSTHLISYSLINKGNGPLIIDTASSSCDCTVPVISKKNISPGDSSILSVQYKPTDTGLFDKKVVIKSNIDSIFSVVSFTGRAIK